MDGTIVDTEPYWIAAEHALVQAYGGTWSHEQAMQLVGQSLTFSAGILQEAGVRLEIREIIDTLTAEVIRNVQRKVPWRPGARELLDDLHSAASGAPWSPCLKARWHAKSFPAFPGSTSNSWLPETLWSAASRTLRRT